MGAKKTASFVIPCLNEEATLPSLLAEARSTFALDKETQWEIVVADNGSTDGSRKIATSMGAQLINVHERGYGAAVNGGIIGARTEYVVYADADGTYAPADAVKLVSRLDESGADLILGTRLGGTIERGAMPFLHRYVGTPVLTLLIRLLHGIPITDCNSGLRGVRRESYEQWGTTEKGMEFASAMLIQAKRANAKILEFPVRLRKAPPDRVPHLRSWRDGMRHLLIVLVTAPHFFWRSGLAVLTLSTAIALGCLVGSVHMGFWGFGPHTLAMATILGSIGSFATTTALMIYSRSPNRGPKLAMKLISMCEGVLFWLLLGLTVGLGLGISYLFWRWSQNQFGGLSEVKVALGIVYFAVVGFSLTAGLFQVHLTKRR